MSALYQIDDWEEIEDTGLTVNGNCLVLKWRDGEEVVYFSMSQRGDAMQMHIATKNGKRKLRQAVNEFCNAIFIVYPEIEKIVGYISKNSVKNLARKCGFKEVVTKQANINGKLEDISLMMRVREWAL